MTALRMPQTSMVLAPALLLGLLLAQGCHSLKPEIVAVSHRALLTNEYDNCAGSPNWGKCSDKKPCDADAGFECKNNKCVCMPGLFKCGDRCSTFDCSVGDTCDANTLIIESNVDNLQIPKLWFNHPGDKLELELFNTTTTIQIKVDEAGTTAPAMIWNAPLMKAAFQGCKYPLRLFGPAIVLGTNAFRIQLTNKLPYQAPCSCGCSIEDPATGVADPNYCESCVLASTVPDPHNPLNVYNGPHNLLASNVHTHGLKIDGGANDVNNLDVCKQEYTQAQACGLAPPGQQSFVPGSTTTTGGVKCPIYADNIYASVLPGGMTGTNTYFPPASVPGIAWYHHHEHGGTAYLTPTSNGPIITPDINPSQLFAPAGCGSYEDMYGMTDWKDWVKCAQGNPKHDSWQQHEMWSKSSFWLDREEWKNSNDKQCSKFSNKSKAACNTFIDIIAELPNFSDAAEILHFAGLWHRNADPNPDPSLSPFPAPPPVNPAVFTPDDDSSEFIACNALPPSSLVCPKGRAPLDPATGKGTNYNLENVQNFKGLDYVAINSVIQPTLKLQAGRYKRWQMLASNTMKWFDLTIRPLPGADGVFGDPVPTCKIFLLAHDGVYLELLPRLTSSTYNGSTANNIVFGPANRLDVLVKCSEEGEYALVSGGGPYITNPSCTAVHCELFGGAIPSGVKNRTGNNEYMGRQLSAALMAVIKVDPRPSSVPVQPELVPEACRTRLELFSYTNVAAYPPQNSTRNQDQCYNMVNQMGGAACNVNGVLFGNISSPISTPSSGLACITQGYSQDWQHRGVAFHPFHLHETPVRIENTGLPACLNTNLPLTGPTSTNVWKGGDWYDVIFVPTCECTGDGCDEVKTRFLGTSFPPVPKDFSTNSNQKLGQVADAFLQAYNALQSAVESPQGNNGAIGDCQDRFAVLHCHHLSHEDEGCMAVVWWKCLNGTNSPCTNGICPNVPAMMAAGSFPLHKHSMG